MNDLEDKLLETEELESNAPHRGIYLLPNLLTTSALFSGFYAVVAAMKGQFETAAIAVFIAMIADALDGRVARLTNTQSAFGAEYDSLSDMVAFGMAPALITYSWVLHFFGKLGWLVAFFYTASTAVRLARFNTQASDKRYFTGLPCPSAAAFIVGMVWLLQVYPVNISAHWLGFGMTVCMFLAGTLMISTVRYRSFKDLEMTGITSFFVVIAILLFFVGVALNPPVVLFALFAVFVVSGPLGALFHFKRKTFD